MATAERPSSDGEDRVLEETYGSSSLTRRFLIVGNTVREGTQRTVGPPLNKFLKVTDTPPGLTADDVDLCIIDA